jgi:hypothetical protein
MDFKALYSKVFEEASNDYHEAVTKAKKELEAARDAYWQMKEKEVYTKIQEAKEKGVRLVELDYGLSNTLQDKLLDAGFKITTYICNSGFTNRTTTIMLSEYCRGWDPKLTQLMRESETYGFGYDICHDIRSKYLF